MWETCNNGPLKRVGQFSLPPTAPSVGVEHETIVRLMCIPR